MNPNASYMRHSIWSDKHAPRSSEDLIVNKAKVKLLREFLCPNSLYQSHSLPPPSLSDSSLDLNNEPTFSSIGSSSTSPICLITGPSGCGKRTCIKLICAELGIKVLQFDNNQEKSMKGEPSLAQQFLQFLEHCISLPLLKAPNTQKLSPHSNSISPSTPLNKTPLHSPIRQVKRSMQLLPKTTLLSHNTPTKLTKKPHSKIKTYNTPTPSPVYTESPYSIIDLTQPSPDHKTPTKKPIKLHLPNLILIQDIPHNLVDYSPTFCSRFSAFISRILNQAQNSSHQQSYQVCSIIICHDTSFIEEKAISKLIPQHLRQNPLFTQIAFNSLTPKNIEKQLKSVCALEGFTQSDLQSTLTDLRSIAEQSNGDLRAALNSLQFSLNGIKRDPQTRLSRPIRDPSPKEITLKPSVCNIKNEYEIFDIFHTMGKMLYNKRFPPISKELLENTQISLKGTSDQMDGTHQQFLNNEDTTSTLLSYSTQSNSYQGYNSLEIDSENRSSEDETFRICNETALLFDDNDILDVQVLLNQFSNNKSTPLTPDVLKIHQHQPNNQYDYPNNFLTQRFSYVRPYKIHWKPPCLANKPTHYFKNELYMAHNFSSTSRHDCYHFDLGFEDNWNWSRNTYRSSLYEKENLKHINLSSGSCTLNSPEAIPKQLKPEFLFPKHLRPATYFNPESVIDQTPCDRITLVKLLHQNYLDFFSSTDDISAVMTHLTFCDSNFGSKLSKDNILNNNSPFEGIGEPSASYFSNIFSRALLDCNLHPKSPSSHGLFTFSGSSIKQIETEIKNNFYMAREMLLNSLSDHSYNPTSFTASHYFRSPQVYFTDIFPLYNRLLHKINYHSALHDIPAMLSQSLAKVNNSSNCRNFYAKRSHSNQNNSDFFEKYPKNKNTQGYIKNYKSFSNTFGHIDTFKTNISQCKNYNNLTEDEIELI